MEHTKEIAKLVRVLRRTARMTMQAEWKGRAEEAVPFNIEQYNRILARLTDLASDTATLFEPLPADSSATVLALACRQLAAYCAAGAAKRKQLAALPCVEVVQAGGAEVVAVFDVADIDQVASIMKPYKRRQYSAASKAARGTQLARVRPSSKRGNRL